MSLYSPCAEKNKGSEQKHEALGGDRVLLPTLGQPVDLNERRCYKLSDRSGADNARDAARTGTRISAACPSSEPRSPAAATHPPQSTSRQPPPVCHPHTGAAGAAASTARRLPPGAISSTIA